jgi:hypothetical protein
MKPQPHRQAVLSQSIKIMLTMEANLGPVNKVITMANNERTSEKAAKSASKVLRDGRTGKNSKTAAASALTQAKDKKKG